jgi:hypothetical protein
MSAFEADRFNHSRTSPEAAISPQLLAVSESRFLRSSLCSGVGMTATGLATCQRPKTNDRQRLTTISKERLQHFRAAACQNPAANLDLVVQLRMIYDLHRRMHGPCLGIIRAIYQALNAGMHQGPGAHSARFNCNKQFAVFQAMVTNGGTGLAQGDDLGVSRRIGVRDVTIPSPADDLACAHYDGAYGHFSSFERALGTAQGLLHPQFVRTGLVGGGLEC